MKSPKSARGDGRLESQGRAAVQGQKLSIDKISSGSGESVFALSRTSTDWTGTTHIVKRICFT